MNSVNVGKWIRFFCKRQCILLLMGVFMMGITYKSYVMTEISQRISNVEYTGPKKVILFTYMRGGSTFLGSLFENHPEVIYFYEGLGSFYKQYLQEKGLITNPVWFDTEQNYTLRQLYNTEKQAVADHIRLMLDCQMRHVYPEGTKTILMRHNNITSRLAMCAVHNLDKTCPHSENTIEPCASPSLNTRFEQGCYNGVVQARQCWLDSECHATQTEPRFRPLLLKLRCYGRGGIPKCITAFETSCKQYRIRTTKVHRLSMQAVDHVIRKTPDIRIIYYVRDPRAIWLSRETRNSPVPLEALCQQMQSDYLLFEKLSLKYPDVFIIVKYEDLAESPIRTANSIFEHIGEKMPPVVRRYLTSITSSVGADERDPHGVEKSNSSVTASAWKQKITASQNENALKYCSSVLKYLGYRA